MLDFFVSLKVVTGDQKNIDWHSLKLYKQDPTWDFSKRIFLGEFSGICEKAHENYEIMQLLENIELLEKESLEEHEIRLMKEDGTFDYKNLPGESDKMEMDHCPTIREIFLSIGQAVIDNVIENGKTSLPIIESSMISNFEYMKNIAKSMPDQSQYFIKENLLKSAKWINQLANELEPLSYDYNAPVEASDEMEELNKNYEFSDEWENLVDVVPMKVGEGYENPFYKFDYDAFVKENEQVQKPALKKTSNSWIIQALGFVLVLVLILILVILFGC